MPKFRKSSVDMPFAKDDANRFVPWIMGLMVFLATLALIGAATVSSVVKKWDQYIEKGFTVELATPPHYDPRFVQINLERQNRALRLLEETTGVKSVQVIANSQKTQYQPVDNGTPVPTLIDVTMRDGYSIDLGRLEDKLANSISGAVVHDNQKERLTAVRLAKSAIWVSVITAALVGLAAIATFAFVTLTGLSVHQHTLEVLNIIGARRKYVAKLFQDHALWLAFRGGIIGAVLSLAALLSLRGFVGKIEVPYIAEGIPSAEIWLVVCITPVVGIVLASFAARLTVMVSLARRAVDT